MPRKQDPLVLLCEQYVKHGLGPAEMANHLRTEFKINPDIFKPVKEEKRKSLPKKQAKMPDLAGS